MKPDIDNTATLEEQQVLAEALFTSIGEGAIATDEFGKITRINPRALDILGTSKKEMIGAWFPKKIKSVKVDGTPVSLIDRPITRAFLTGKIITEKGMYVHKDGHNIPVTITVSPVILEGKPVGAIEVFRDITVEAEVDKLKSDFISLASHQLRTPLSAIKTYSHMLIDGYMGEVSSAQKKSLRTIIAGTNRMNELISTLLNITRLESGNMVANIKEVYPVRLLEEIAKEHALSAADRDIHLIFDSPKRSNLSLKTDALLFKEILSNLVSNAIKYTPEGGKVSLHVKKRRYDVLFSVADSGVGIPNHAQDQIFTKFFRAQNVVRQETSGTGLGLYLVKGIVDALDGKIWFESQEGKGTVFYVCLPK